MKLIGMLDSPYVRRVAVSLQLLEVPFEHQSLSVFRTFDQFRQINPVVKAPTLVAADGTVLMDSTLILQYAETLAAPERRLTPSEPAALLRSLRVLGLALAACDKGVQIVYERNVRPAEKLHQPWVERVGLRRPRSRAAREAAGHRRPRHGTRRGHDRRHLAFHAANAARAGGRRKLSLARRTVAPRRSAAAIRRRAARRQHLFPQLTFPDTACLYPRISTPAPSSATTSIFTPRRK
jgi:glutathione S-transferase